MVLSLSMDPSIRDGNAAMKAYDEACKLGEVMARCDAGHTLEHGTIIKKDFARAASFYKRGCDPDEGMFICSIGLANLYSTGGPGLAKDRKLRNSYYRRAKLLGYSDHMEDD